MALSGYPRQQIYQTKNPNSGREPRRDTECCVEQAGTSVPSRAQLSPGRPPQVSVDSQLQPNAPFGEVKSFPIPQSPFSSNPDYSPVSLLPLSPKSQVTPAPDYRGTPPPVPPKPSLPPAPDYRGTPPPVPPKPSLPPAPDYRGTPPPVPPKPSLLPAPDYSPLSLSPLSPRLQATPPPDYRGTPPPVPPKPSLPPAPDYSPGLLSPISSNISPPLTPHTYGALKPPVPPKPVLSRAPKPPIPPKSQLSSRRLPSELPLNKEPQEPENATSETSSKLPPRIPTREENSAEYDSTWSTVWPDAVYEQEKKEWSDECSPQQSGQYNLPPFISFDDRVAGMKGGGDPYVKSKRVFELSHCTFKKFLQKQDTALVLFYDVNMKHKSKESTLSAKNFIKAAENTIRPNSAYATVNCEKNVRLCMDEGIITFPYYKLYSKGVSIGFITDTANYDHKLIRAFVEESPVAS